MIRCTAILVILMSVASVSAAPADVLDDIARDFAPISGYVVMQADGDFLIDLDAAGGIAVGDLFSVVAPGEKIVHPVSGKVLGMLDRVKGFLQVTGIQSGYSRARPLSVKEQFKRGDVIRRFDHIPAVFLDATGEGRTIFKRLRTDLTELEWRYESIAGDRKWAHLPEGALLAFVFGPDRIEVRGPDATLRSYEIPAELRGAPPLVSTEPGKERPKERDLSEGRMEGVGKAAPAGFTVLGTLPEETLMADFGRDGDRLLLAVTEGTRIDVFAVGDNLAPVATGECPRAGRILSLHWWRPQPGAPPMLAASVAVEENRAYSPAIGQTVMGVLFAIRDGRLVPIEAEIPYLLGSFDRDGDGVRETLLGQAFDRDIFFGDRIRELRWSGKDLTIGEPSPPVSLPFAVQGALFADLTGDGRTETAFVRNRTLFIYNGGDLIYESSQQMGGSLSALTYDLNPGAADRIFTTVAFEVPPVAVDLNGDGRTEVVAIASEGSGLSAIVSRVRKSWLATLEYREGRIVRGTLGPELETPLQGLHAGPTGVFVVATHAPSPFKPKRASHVLFLPLNDRAHR